MFDQVLQLVKEHFGNNQQVADAIPPHQTDAVHHEIANSVVNGLQDQAAQNGGAGGLLSMLSNGVSSGSPITSAIEGGLVGSLANKFGLPPAATGAIAAALPGLLQKFVHKTNDPNDQSLTPESVSSGLSGGLGGLF